VPQVVDAVGLPVVAAGGIADGRGIAAALTLGAAGVQVGTAFLACDESNASEPHKAALVSPHARNTSLTRAFTGRLARGIRNQALVELEKSGPPPPYPIRAWFFSPITKAAIRAERPDSMPLWCGQSAALARRRSAAACFSALVDETDRVFASV
jgi:nitronate monooxygenase